MIIRKKRKLINDCDFISLMRNKLVRIYLKYGYSQEDIVAAFDFAYDKFEELLNELEEENEKIS